MDPLCLFDLTSCATSVAKSGFGALFDALTDWVVASVQWLLSAASAVLDSASEPATVLSGSKGEFDALLALGPILLTIGLLVATLQALRHGDAAAIWRSYLGVAPACVAGVVLARPVALLILEAVNQMCSSAASGVASEVPTLARSLTTLAPTTPGFGLLLLAGSLVVGTLLLWFELVVRTVALTLLLVLVPVVVPLSALPVARRLGWRLAETFVALALSKFVIVVTLALGMGEVTSGGPGAATGAVTLLLACASPFVLLRLVPFVEQSALHQLEGLRSRATRVVANVGSSPVGRAVAALQPDAPIPGPPTRGEDLGLATWPGVEPEATPPWDEGGEPPPPPVGTPLLRGGHVVYQHDEHGPVVGWHFDE